MNRKVPSAGCANNVGQLFHLEFFFFFFGLKLVHKYMLIRLVHLDPVGSVD